VPAPTLELKERRRRFLNKKTSVGDVPSEGNPQNLGGFRGQRAMGVSPLNHHNKIFAG